MIMTDWRAHQVKTAYKNNTSLMLGKKERALQLRDGMIADPLEAGLAYD